MSSRIDGPILPRMKTTQFLKATAAIPGMNADNTPLSARLAGDLVLTYAVDMEEAFVSVTPVLMRERGLTPIAVHEQALENLGPFAQQLEAKSLGPAYQVSLPNDLTACIYLFDDFWADIKRQLGANPLAVFAHRNFVAFTGENDAEGLAFLEHALGALPQDQHTLSSQLYVWNNRWHPRAGY